MNKNNDNDENKALTSKSIVMKDQFTMDYCCDSVEFVPNNGNESYVAVGHYELLDRKTQKKDGKNTISVYLNENIVTDTSCLFIFIN